MGPVALWCSSRRQQRRHLAGAVGPVDLGQHPLAGGGVVQELFGLDGGDAGGDGLQLGLDDQEQGAPALAAGLIVCLPLGAVAVLPGRAVVGVAEVLGIGQLQDEADASVRHGEDDGGQVALGSVCEAVGAVALEGLLDLVAGAHGADGGVAGVGHNVHVAVGDDVAVPEVPL